MNEFKREFHPEINNDDKLGDDYVKQFTELNHQKSNELKENGDKVLSSIEDLENKQDEDSCEYDAVVRMQTKYEDSLKRALSNENKNYLNN